MPSPSYLLWSLVTVLAVTFALRALPFAVIGPLRSSALVRFLNVHMPVGILVILAAYTLRTTPVLRWPFGLPEALALLVTVGLHLWRHNAVLSILTGTATYVLLVNTVFG